MAAPQPPNPVLDRTKPRPSTALSAVFRRIGGEAVASAPLPSRPPAASRAAPSPRSAPPQHPPLVTRAAPPPRPAPPPPQLLGFAEPVTQVPPVEEFLPRQAPLAPEARARERIAAPEPAPPSPPPPDHPPARASEPPQITPIPSPPMPRPKNIVGRLGRRLGDAPSPRQEAPAPRFDPLPAPSAPKPSPAPPAAPAPAAKPAAPTPGAVAERSGRPSLPRNRRLYRRAKLPAEIEIAGVPCTLIDVSIGGFAASDVPQVEPNALVPVVLRLTIDGIEVGTQLSARIIYVTHGRSSGRFVDLAPNQMAFLRYIVTWRGESVGAVGTTTLLDAISGGAEPLAQGDDAKSRWWAGLIGRKINPPR